MRKPEAGKAGQAKGREKRLAGDQQ